MKKPLVSVVMPVYNDEKYVGEAIESILNQTFEDFEFIIIDDASKDNSLKIIKEYAKKDKRIKLIINKKNKGNWATRNIGMESSVGKYILTQDSDDLSKKERIMLQVNTMEKNPKLGALGSNIEIINSKGGEIKKRKYPEKDENIRKMIYFFSPLANPSTIIRKTVLKKSGMFNSKLRVSGDLDLWFRIGNYYQLGNLNKTLIKYRDHENNITKKKIRLMEKTANKIRWKNWKNPSYQFGVKAFFYNLLHAISIYLVPPKIKLWLYGKLRK
jgi:glycosyltransferase involved in cell wall biosynthesis